MEKDKITENKLVKTFAEDMAQVLEGDREGLVKKIIHGEKKHEEEKKNLSPESQKNKTFMIIGFLLIIIAFAVFIFLLTRKENNVVPVEKQFIPIIFNDKTTFVEVSELNKDEVMQTVLGNAKSSKVKNGGVDGIYVTENKQIIGLRRFISLIKGNFIPGENKLLVDDNFLMGVVKNQEDAGTGFFILLKVRSLSDVFESMRAWEAKMFSDLYKFFDINLNSDTNYLLTKNFEDSIVDNKNARILYDNANKPVLMYVFADDNSVIITDSQNATHEIMLRLASSQKKQ